MPTYEVAHVREQGEDLVIVVVDSKFRRKSDKKQREIQQSLQACAQDAGLAGTVVPVWDEGRGRIGFLAPKNYHPFFESISMADVPASVNKELRCNA
jgi:hypothetical protein